MMTKAFYYFSKCVKNPNSIRLFRVCIYLYVLMFTLLLLPAFNEIYGPKSFLLPYYKMPSRLLYFLDPLNYINIRNLHWFMLTILILAVLTFLIKRNKRWLSVLIYFSYSALYHKAAALQNGGTNLILLLLFFLIFVDEEDKKKGLNTFITNLAVLTIKFQIVFMYFVAGVYKFQGELWLNGSALYHVLSIDEYSHPLIQPFIEDNLMLKVLTWTTLALQLLFPLLIWFKKTKGIMIIAGTIFHLAIAFVVGLFDFGIAMIVAYTIFYDESKSSDLLNKFQIPKLKAYFYRQINS